MYPIPEIYKDVKCKNYICFRGVLDEHIFIFDNYIKYSWEHSNDDFSNKVHSVLSETEILVIIGYSFPAFNRRIDQNMFDSLVPDKIKKIVY